MPVWGWQGRGLVYCCGPACQRRVRVRLHQALIAHNVFEWTECGEWTEKLWLYEGGCSHSLAVWALPNGLVSFHSKGHSLLELDSSVWMLISVYGLLYPFANHDSKEETLGCETLHMPINHKLNQSWHHESDCVGSWKASVSQPLLNLWYYRLQYLGDCKGNKEYGRVCAERKLEVIQYKCLSQIDDLVLCHWACFLNGRITLKKKKDLCVGSKRTNRIFFFCISAKLMGWF